MIGDKKLDVKKSLMLLMLFAIGSCAGWMVHGIQSLTGTTNFFIVLTNQKTGENFAVPIFEWQASKHMKR